MSGTAARVAMSIGRMVKRQAKAAIAPTVFLLLVAYFLFSATQGERGLRATRVRAGELKAAQAEQARADAELAGWDRRVAALRASRLDADALDERVRAMLNLADPTEIVVPYPPGRKLF